MLRRTRASLAHRLHRILPPGPVLDVGAGDGTLVEAFARHGREAVGLEPHASGPHIRNAEIEEMTGAWAAAIFWHSLEHLRQPSRALSHAASLLVPGGLLVVAVPNAASLQARAFGDRWFALDLPRHLAHLSPAPLLSKVEALGLRVERVSYLRGGQVVFGWVHGLVGQLPGRPISTTPSGAARRSTAQTPPAPLHPRRRRRRAPLALAATAAEVAARSGDIYVQARRYRAEPAREPDRRGLATRLGGLLPRAGPARRRSVGHDQHCPGPGPHVRPPVQDDDARGQDAQIAGAGTGRPRSAAPGQHRQPGHRRDAEDGEPTSTHGDGAATTSDPWLAAAGGCGAHAVLEQDLPGGCGGHGKQEQYHA